MPTGGKEADLKHWQAARFACINFNLFL